MRKIEELQTKIDELQKELDELKKQEKGGGWKPEIGEIYWFVNSYGEITRERNSGTKIDSERFLLGNKYKTKEECDFSVEKSKVMEELRQFAEPKDRKWDGERTHWNIMYNTQWEKVYTDWWATGKTNNIYFESGEKAQQAIDAVGEDRVKKYYLEVE